MTSEAVVVLQARMGSRRLPGKSLAAVGGVPIVALCLRRLLVSDVGPVLLATTTEPEDDCLVAEAARLGIAAIRGSRDDVLGRFVQAVSQTRAAFVVRATADNPAVDIDGARRVLEGLERWGADYCCERGLPVGGAVEAIRTSALIDASARAMSDADREHVTTCSRCDRSRYRVATPDAPRAVRRPDVRLTIDTQADLAFMRSIAVTVSARLASASFSAIIAAADQVQVRDGPGDGDRLAGSDRELCSD